MLHLVFKDRVRPQISLHVRSDFDALDVLLNRPDLGDLDRILMDAYWYRPGLPCRGTSAGFAMGPFSMDRPEELDEACGRLWARTVRVVRANDIELRPGAYRGVFIDLRGTNQ